MKTEPILPCYEHCLQDESHLKGRAETICFPETPEEAAQWRKEAAAAGLTVTVRGAGTGLMGGAVPRGGLVMDLSRLKKMGKPERRNDGTVTIRAQAGVTLEAMAEQAEPWLFAPNPTETTATLGGIFATGAAGSRELRYGAVSAHVETLSWVTPSGELWEIPRGACCCRNGLLPLPGGGQAPCGQEGRDLIDLLSGTEGTRGMAVSMEWRLYEKPGEVWGLVFFFETEQQAVRFGEGLLKWRNGTKNSPAYLTAAEYLNPGALALLDSRRDLSPRKELPDFPGKAALRAELSGTEEGINEALPVLLDLFEACGGREEASWAENTAGAVRRFAGLRHQITAVLGELPEICGPDGTRWEADFRGNPEDAPAFLEAFGRGLQKYGLSGVIYGPMLINSLHLALLPGTEAEKACCDSLLRELAAFALCRGGDLRGEYGLGRLKQKWM